ncbi:Glutamate synthase (NADPH) small chain [Candidatus Terasakiella magnetica]|uniref:dihydrouracil dehydrogenase (NAD(+)) n=1 Tax=Candidatus Terasakiella magnetica TaxID=1867952 RepID=A0A1C3RD26_9PROT|nr:FAD-dependent oxidoreductase [Candidatus Terasakiella magnetica]SCA55152.1 Glutamate synthase (NADPH) small chain [Candidatus Terasakiella magnetica]
MKPTNTSDPTHFHKVVDCQYACPAHTPVPEYIRLILARRYTDSYMVNWEANVFPGVLGRVCDRPCEPACRRQRVEEKPVAICRLKRVAADNKEDIKERLPLIPEQKNGKKIALLGAGPASLTVARDLMPLGYDCTIFDRDGLGGGMMRTQIPSFRLPLDTLNSEVDTVLDFGVETRFGQELTSMQAILDEDFDAVVVGTGAPSGRPLQMDGLEEAGDHVQIGINWLAGVTFEHVKEAPKRVVVLGGGNTAMDCTRTARRLGAHDVKAIVRSSYDEMKSSEWEREDAMAENVEILPNHTPLRYVVEDGKFIGVEFDRVETHWEKGKRKLISTGEDPVLVECDLVLVAIGQDASFPWIEGKLGIDFDDWGMPVLNKDTLQSTNEKVFFAGDAAFGPENIITAVAHGHIAAASIDRMLSDDKELSDVPFGEYDMTSQKMGIHEWSYQSSVSNDPRNTVPVMNLEEALQDLSKEVELGFDEKLALKEAARCLSCDVQTVFTAERCIECVACEDICPMDCINFTDNGDEDDLRTRLRVPAPDNPRDLYVSGELKSKQVMVKDEDVCLHCGLCAERCPTGAWDMQKFLFKATQVEVA